MLTASHRVEHVQRCLDGVEHFNGVGDVQLRHGAFAA